MKAPFGILLAILFVGFAADAQKALPPKKKKAPAKTTSLPAYKGKKKITVDFENNSGTHTGTTVVVRTPLPLEEALKDHDAAEKSRHNEVTTVQPPSPALDNPQASQIQVQELPELSLTPSPSAPNTKVQVQKQSKGSQKQLQLQVLPRPQTPPLVAEPAVERLVPPAVAPAAEQAPAITEKKAEEPVIIEPFIAPKITVQELEAEKPTAPKVDPEAAQAISAIIPVLIAPSQEETPRFFVQTSYLSAPYSRVDERLKNGATTLALGLGRDVRGYEVRGVLEFGHGLDQSVTPRNTRMTLLKGEALKIFRSRHVSPFVGLGVGYADLYLFSYRSQNGETHTIREHLKGGALAVNPIVGARAGIPHTGGLVVDLTAEYLVLLGAGQSGNLGGLLGRLSVGIPF
jgi:hypothetical protein